MAVPQGGPALTQLPHYGELWMEPAQCRGREARAAAGQAQPALASTQERIKEVAISLDPRPLCPQPGLLLSCLRTGLWPFNSSSGARA